MKIDAISTDPYAAIAEFYDLEHDDFEDDLGFYLNMAMMAGGPVLELGCGSGRILKPLLAAGLKVTGLDSSEVMLGRAEARLRSKRERAGLTLDKRSMAAADHVPGGPFGVVVLGLNGLLHATTSSEERALLKSACAALRQGGQLLLDVVNPATLRDFNGEVLHEGSWVMESGSRVDKFSSRQVSFSTQELDVALWYDVTSPDGSIRRIHSGFTQRFVHRSELELMLEMAGFSSWTVYGGYELDPFEDNSDRIVIAAER
jgi:SAM-dependent methyltransferase